MPFHPARNTCGNHKREQSMQYRIPSSRRIAAMVGTLAIACWSGVAQAQSLPQQQVEQDGATEEAASRNHIIIGAGAGYAPAYQGSDNYIVLPIPAIDIVQGRFFANLRNGIGVNVIDTEHVTIGASLTYTPGYRAKDAPEGIGKLSVGLGGRGFVALKWGGAIATIGATKGFLGGTKGIIADASLAYPVAVTSRLTLIPTLGTTWADRKNNDRYFGIDAVQSLASGLPEFHTGSGFKDASAQLAASYRLTDHLSLGVSGGVSRLLGAVQDSPMVVQKTQPFGFASLAYRF
jgi:outer membrane protein